MELVFRNCVNSAIILQPLSLLVNFIFILTYTALRYGGDTMFYTGVSVLILILIHFMVCLWQWWLNNCYRYEWLQMEEETEDNFEQHDSQNNNDVDHKNDCNICVDAIIDNDC